MVGGPPGATVSNSGSVGRALLELPGYRVIRNAEADRPALQALQPPRYLACRVENKRVRAGSQGPQ